MYKSKTELLNDFPELELTEFGDFAIKSKLIEPYEIIDFHCHLYKGAKSFVPKPVRKDHEDMNKSFFDLSCYPITIESFDFDRVLYTSYPFEKSKLGIVKTAYELLGMGGFYSAMTLSTPERMLRDMTINHISKAVVLQLNTPDCDSGEEMKGITQRYDRLINFGSIHPNEKLAKEKIAKNLKYGVRGWKIAPHVIGENIDSVKTIELMKMLHDTNLPIVSCSGLALPEEVVAKLPNKISRVLQTQNISRFENLLQEVPNLKLTFSHGGLYQSEELIELMNTYKDTTVDISTQPSKNIKKFIDNIGSERVLYGTDYPAFNHAFPIVSVLRATDCDEERRNVFFNNAKRLLKI